MERMLYIFVPDQLEIPEWKQCYYDSDTLNDMIKFVKHIQNYYSRIKKQIMTNNLSNLRQSQSNQSLSRAKLNIRKFLMKWSHLFYEYSDEEAKVIYMFVQMKTFEIRDKYKLYCKLFLILPKYEQKMLMLLENLYIEAFYTNNAIAYNMALQTTTVKRYYKQISTYSEFNFELQVNKRMLRMKKYMNTLLSKIQFTYTLQSHSKQRKAEKRLKKLGTSNATIGANQFGIIGLVMGIIFFMIGLILIILRANNINLESNDIFKQQFPVWRGASYILLYMWILGLCVLFYEVSQINYKLIFRFETQNLPHSKFIFLCAATFTLIYLILFLIFVSELSELTGTNFIYYGQLFWLMITAYLFFPLPILQYQGRLYFLRLLLNVIISPCIPINILIIWISQQLVSLNQPFGDFFYTICHFATRNSKECSAMTPNFTSAYIITMFTMRIIQNFKFWHQNSQIAKQYNFQAPPFLGGIRAFFGLNTAIAALVYRLKAFENAFEYWLFFSIVTTLVSWIVDLKGDWGLLGFQHKFLREKLLFPKAKAVYYIMAILNLALRTAWVLSISPFVVNSSGFMPFIFIMVVSYIEIIRRGIWNVLRIQFEHIRNCGQFRATINDSKILKEMKSKAEKIIQQNIQKLQQEQLKKREKQHSDSKLQINLIHSATIIETKKEKNINFLEDLQKDLELRDLRMNKQLEIFKENLKKRRKLKQDIKAFREQWEKNLQEIIQDNQKYIKIPDEELD